MNATLMMNANTLRTVDIPCTWSEVTSEQGLQLSELVVSGKYPPQQLLIAWCVRMLGFTHHAGAGNVIKAWVDPESVCEFNPVDIAVITCVLDFILTPDNTISEGLLYPPEVDGLRAPAEVLSDITFGQYQMLCECMGMLNRAVEDDRERLILRMAGILYRPLGHTWKSDLIDWYVREVTARMDAASRLAMLWYIAGSMRLLSDRFGRVFSGDAGSSDADPLESQLRIMEVLSDGDVTRRDAIRRANLIDVLSNLEYKIERAEKEKQQNNNAV